MKRWLSVLMMLRLAGELQAQASPDSVKQRDRCRLAAQIVTTGHPAPHEGWATSFITQCGPTGGQAIAAGLRALRLDTDTLALDALFRGTRFLRDSSIVAAAMEIAADRTASEEARVMSLRTLMFLFAPFRDAPYGELLAARGIPARPRSCGVSSMVADSRMMDGAPVTAGLLTAVRTLAAQLFADPANSVNIRAAAYCVDQSAP